MKFKVSETYSIWTYEDTNLGCNMDSTRAKNGSNFEDDIYTLSELKYYLEREGYHREHGANYFQHSQMNNYNGETTITNLHIEAVK